MISTKIGITTSDFMNSTAYKEMAIAVADQTVHAGHTISIKVAGKLVGKAQGFDGDRDFGTEGVYEIGSIMPSEHINLRYQGTISFERFLLRKDDLNALGLTPLGEDVLKKGLITFEIQDKYTGKLVRAYHGCSIVNCRETIRANALAGENATFTYLNCTTK